MNWVCSIWVESQEIVASPILSFRPKGEIFPAGRRIYSLAKDFSVANAPSKWQTLGSVTEMKHTQMNFT